MTKSKFELEYDLKSPSLNALWTSLGTPFGLSEWFADGVTVNQESEYVFSWDGTSQTAILLATKPQDFIRFQWEEDANTDAYFEIKISVNKLTSNVVLHITDFAEETEKEDAILLWNKQIENMMRKNGL